MSRQDEAIRERQEVLRSATHPWLRHHGQQQLAGGSKGEERSEREEGGSERDGTNEQEKPSAVTIVYGSFECGQAVAAAKEIRSLAPSNLHVREPQSGDEFDFDTLKDTRYLIVCASSQNGFPPANLTDFMHQLCLAADTAEPDCLNHLRHAVWGEGDPRWHRTYMNIPRYADLLLEECGSRRFYARGEAHEPHAPTGASKAEVSVWATGMWEALNVAAAANSEEPPPVTWQALWAHEESTQHHDVTEFGLESLIQRYGELRGRPSVFARPDEYYWRLVEEARREREERAKAMAERRAAAARRNASKAA